jgi:glycosyltransferase involved in cell wall biosynthesis
VPDFADREVDMEPKSKNREYIVVDPPIGSFSGGNIDLNNPPKVSFVIPSFNSARTLDECLNSISSQEYPDIEIIIVDQYSTDNTVEIARKYTDKIYFHRGPLGDARQTSIEHSTGDILAIFDSDIVIPHKNWLMNAIKYFNYSNSVSTVWTLNIAPPDASLSARLYADLEKVTMEDRIKKKRGLYGGGNALFLRKCMNEIGGINRTIHWGEDFDWAGRLKNSGYQVVSIKDPLYHDTMGSLKQFTKKQFTGAATFASVGFQLMGLSLSDVVYEQVIVGTKGMITGLIKKRDAFWLLFPLFISIRVLAYGYTYLLNRIRRPSKRRKLKLTKRSRTNL